MAAKQKLTAADKFKGGKVPDIVSDDRNWRTYVWKELKSTEGWQNDWGFLSVEADANTIISHDEKIKKLEQQLKESKLSTFGTTSNAYGSGPTLQRFQDKFFNKRKAVDIKPADRRPPKKK